SQFEDASVQQAESFNKTPEYSFSAQREPHKQKYESPSSDQKFEFETYESPFSHDEIEQIAQVDESSSSSSHQEHEAKQKKSKKKKKSMSITEFLGRKTSNENQVKLKVCIVQQGETLDSLSERYDLPVQQILRVNHLEANQDVYEGQVLYIPVTNK